MIVFAMCSLACLVLRVWYAVHVMYEIRTNEFMFVLRKASG